MRKFGRPLLIALSLSPGLVLAAEEEQHEQGVDTEHIVGFTEGSDIGEKGEREVDHSTYFFAGKPGNFIAVLNETEDAEGAAAVGDDLLRRIDFGEPRLERAHGDVHRAGQMPQGEFVFRPDVEDNDRPSAVAPPAPRKKQLLGCRDQRMRAHDTLDFRRVPLGDLARRNQQIENAAVGDPVIDELAVAPRAHHAGSLHMRELLRGVGDQQTGLLREEFYATLALGELL